MVSNLYSLRAWRNAPFIQLNFLFAGIPIDLLCAYYKKHSGVLLNEETVKQFGCERVADFLRKLDDLVELRRSDEFRYIVYLRNAFDIKPLKPQRNHDLRAQASTESEGATSMVDESVRRRVFNLFSKQRRVIKLDDFMDTYEVCNGLSATFVNELIRNCWSVSLLC